MFVPMCLDQQPPSTRGVDCSLRQEDRRTRRYAIVGPISHPPTQNGPEVVVLFRCIRGEVTTTQAETREIVTGTVVAVVNTQREVTGHDACGQGSQGIGASTHTGVEDKVGVK